MGDQERLLVKSGYRSLHYYLGGQLASITKWLQGIWTQKQIQSDLSQVSQLILSNSGGWNM